jgi:integral membrane protein
VSFSALTRFRFMAYATGIMLLVLVFVAMPLKYLADEPGPVDLIGPVHGLLYFGYVVIVLDLAFRRRWSLWRTLLVMLAGTIPFASFVAERRVTRAER